MLKNKTEFSKTTTKISHRGCRDLDIVLRVGLEKCIDRMKLDYLKLNY